MMSDKSATKFHPAWRLFAFTGKSNIPLSILIGSFLLLICPGYMYMFITRQLEYLQGGQEAFSLNGCLSGLQAVIASIAVAAVVLYCFLNFRFLYSRKSGDLFHSLPVTRRTMLCTRLAASVVPVVLLLVLVYGFMLSLLLIDGVTGSAGRILMGFICTVLLVLMSAAFATVFLICAGSEVDFFVSFGIVNVGSFLILFILSRIAESRLYGFSGDFWPDSSVSPIFFGLQRIYHLAEDGFTVENGLVYFLVSMPVMTAVFYLASVLLYDRRRAEKNGDSYAYRFVYVLCGLLVGYIGSYVIGVLLDGGANGSVVSLCFAAAGALLTAVAFGAITDRGFKKVKGALAIGSCSFLLLVGTGLVFSTGGFGYSSRIPESDRVLSGTVQLGGEMIEFTDPQEALALHRELVQDKTDSESGETVLFHYQLKNGKMMKRFFVIDSEAHGDALLVLYRGKAHAQTVADWKNRVRDGALTAEIYERDEDNALTRTLSDAYLSESEFNRLVDAYLLDLPSATGQSLNYKYTKELYVTLSARESIHSFRFAIEDHFEHTKAVLASLPLAERAAAAHQDYEP